MLSPETEIQIIASVTAVACALPGVYLVLRRMALISDAITHSILFGIVVAYFFTKELNSPWLIVAAAATGVLTAALSEALSNTRLVYRDAAIGLVFPVLFSIAIILISRFAGNVHIDTDSVILGELALAPFDRFMVHGNDLGPISLWVMGCILAVNAAALVVFHKELKLATFDAGLATALGFSPILLHYGLMTLVSVTAVGAFEAVGSILVVALMIVPPATAYLLTDRLSRMILWSAGISVAGAIGGFWLAWKLDASIAGCIAAVQGLLFAAAHLCAPNRGLLAMLMRRQRQALEFAQKMLAIHLLNHENKPEAEIENSVAHLDQHLRWKRDFVKRVVARSERQGLVIEADGRLTLTESGRQLAQESLVA
ncbi:MAG: metal ABC transporter permease [Candidatus Sumerlaeaceae bacterium]|nr:metal ABC transporter permease [Candidatus Sumerlaeaceae bacterium]